MTTELSEANQRVAVDLEYKLTVAHRLNCWCSEYLVRRREVLIPEVMKEAKRRGEDPVDVFADFARKLHAKKCSTPTPGRIAALFAHIADQLKDPA
jgi:hypothetical protein